MEKQFKKIKALKKENADLKQAMKEIRDSNEEMRELYPGAPIKILPSLLASLTGASTKEGTQVRNLLGAFFTETELLNSTRTGKPSSANKKKDQDADVLPALDKTKVNAIIGMPSFPYLCIFIFRLLSHSI
jgi:BEN domain